MINEKKTSNILHGSRALPDWIYYQLHDEIPPNVALDRQHKRIIRELEERERMAQFKKREDDLKKKEQELNKREKELQKYIDNDLEKEIEKELEKAIDKALDDVLSSLKF